MVIGTTSLPDVMESMEVTAAFNVVQHVPLLDQQDTKEVLKELQVFPPSQLDHAVSALDSEVNSFPFFFLILAIPALCNYAFLIF